MNEAISVNEKGFDGWHRGEWKKSGLILFKMRVSRSMNFVIRLIAAEGFSGGGFLEDVAVSKAAKELGFDIEVLP
jgi:hypothetical protein